MNIIISKMTQSMKKIVILFATVSVLMMVASCQKESPLAADKVKVQIEVADLEPDTKAIKTGWVAGDKINIWFGDAYWDEVPQLVLTRTAGGTWAHSEISASVLAGLSATGGTFKAVYEASNTMFNTAISSAYAYFPNNEWFEYSYGGSVRDAYIRPAILSCYANAVSYEYDGSTITATITGWHALTGLQVVVAGLEGDASDYVATFNNYVDYAGAFYFNPGTKQIERGAYGTCNGLGNAYNWDLGVSNPDGVAFYFNGLNLPAPAPAPGEKIFMTIFLYMKSTTTLYYYTFDMTVRYPFSYAMKMPFSSFTEEDMS